MKRTNIEFVLDDVLQKIDGILSSAKIIDQQGSYDPQQAKTAGGAFVESAVFVAKFNLDSSNNMSLKNQAVANHILLSVVYSLISCQSFLIYFDWDGHLLRAVFNTTKKTHIDATLDVAAKLISMTDVINYKIGNETGITYRIKAAIGFGRLFNIITEDNESLWSGDILKETEKLIDQSSEKRIVVSKFIYRNLKEEYQNLFKPVNVFDTDGPFHADIINIGLNNWLKERIENK